MSLHVLEASGPNRSKNKKWVNFDKKLWSGPGQPPGFWCAPPKTTTFFTSPLKRGVERNSRGGEARKIEFLSLTKSYRPQLGTPMLLINNIKFILSKGKMKVFSILLLACFINGYLAKLVRRKLYKRLDEKKRVKTMRPCCRCDGTTVFS